MKKIFTLLVALMASVGTMFAWDYEQVPVGNLYYNIDISNHYAVVSYKSYGVGCGCYNRNWDITSAHIPETIVYDNVIYRVTGIGAFAFAECHYLSSITIPNSVTNIGYGAFRDCWNLTSITIPNSVTSIGADAFYNCNNLSSITIPDSIASIGESAFCSCESLTSVTISDITAWCHISFEGACANPLYYAHNLYLDGSLVTDLLLSDSVTNIGDYAFYNCSNLSSITIPDSVASIGDYAFCNCSYLSSVTIGNSVISIGDGAFYNCSSINTIEIPNSVTSIGKAAFYDCSSLTSVTIPNSVQSIGGSAFYDCSSLTSVTIPNSVQSIYESTFEGCSKMAYAVIGRSVDHMDYNAFRHCSSLQYVKCLALNPPEMEHSEPWNNVVFEGVTCPNCPNAILFVPSESVELYKTAYQWKDFKSILPIGEADPTFYTIRFLNWNGDLLSEKVLLENTIPQYLGPTPTKAEDEQYRYSFIGWTPEIVPVTEDAVYTATYRAIVTVRFLNWDGTILQSGQVYEGYMPSYTGATPVRPEDEQYTYSFSGWSPTIVKATADVDYTAQFTAIKKTHSIPTVQDLATAGYDVANKVVLCFYFDDAPCYDVVIAGTYMADEAGSWITDPEQLVHMAALESFEGWYAAEIPYSNNVQGKPIQLKSNGAFSWEYQSGDADAWTNKGGAGSQTATIWAGYNNEANIYYYSPGCYIYELAYWKNHNSPCANTTHNYTIHLYAPDACEEMKPAIIGNFNNWNTGVAMKDTTDAQGKKIYTITIASDEGMVFKFRDASYDNWSNELQEYQEGYNVWATFSNFIIPAATQDTTIVYDFSDNDKYRFKLCEKVEDVIVWLKVPTGAPGYYNGAIEMVVYSAGEPATMPLQYNQEDSIWSVELQTKGSNYFSVREANSGDNYILDNVHYYYSDGSDEYLWETWNTTFQNYWENGTGDFVGYKTAMIDLTNPASFKWAVPAIETDIENVQRDDVPCTMVSKFLRDGQIYILNNGIMYNVQGQKVK